MLVRVREDPRFVREGDDLITVLDVAAPLAALGATLEVPTLEGSAEIEVPAGSQPGEVLTLQREGMPAQAAARKPHFPAKARAVIWLFMTGGPSQVDTFDYKPELQKRDGQTALRDATLYQAAR